MCRYKYTRSYPMTIRPDPRSLIRTRAAIRTSRRLFPCYRHPNEPIAGICASCLRERLSGLDAAAIPNACSPELRRCRTLVSTSRCEASSGGLIEPRRKSCDVISARSSFSNLFDADDLKSGSENEAEVESKKVGLLRVTYTVMESKRKNQDDIRVLSDKLGELNVDCAGSEGEVEEGEFKSMKEYIDLEFGNKSKKSKDLRDIAGNIWGAASVFSKKLRKWRQKNSKIKEQKNSSNDKLAGNNGNLKLFQDRGKFEESHAEVVGRRSFDMEQRFSIDAGRMSFEEPRASWDGYMMARTIPRLAPMFSVVGNGILGDVSRFENHRLSVDGPMHSIIEDESSSGASGSGHSNSDSSSMRRSSFDRSSSVRSIGKKGSSSEDHGVSPVTLKLVITERELKDGHLSSSRDDDLEQLGSISRDTATTEGVDNVNVSAKRTVRWRKVCNVFSFKQKNRTVRRDANDPFIDDASEKQGKEAGGHLSDIGDWKLARSSSVVGSRNPCDVIGSNYRRRSVDTAGFYAFKGRDDFKLERNRSARYSSADLEDGTTPFYMTPLRSLKNSKSGKFNLHNPHSMAGNLLRLN